MVDSVSKTVTCRHCQEPFQPQPGKPGFRDECPECMAERFIVADPLFGLSDSERKYINGLADKKRLSGEKRNQFLRNWRIFFKEPLDF